MELQPPLLPQVSYATLEELISAVNVFAATQGYAVVKKRTKKSKKDLLRKAVLMCDGSKAHVDEGRFARDIISCKCDWPFDTVVLTDNNVWVLRV